MTVLRIGNKVRPMQLKTFQSVDCEFNEFRRLLKVIIPADGYADDAIAVAGSAPLFWLQRFGEVGPVWFGGPKDIDIFVCGKYAHNFEALVEHVKVKLEAEHYYIVDVRNYVHNYACATGKVRICDFTISSFHRKLSLIQCPFNDSIEDVIDSFDLNVCRVVYSNGKDELRVAREVYKSIRKKEAVVDSVYFPGGVNAFQGTKVQRTIERMEKYRSRGFRIVNGGGIVFVPAVPAVI